MQLHSDIKSLLVCDEKFECLILVLLQFFRLHFDHFKGRIFVSRFVPKSLSRRLNDHDQISLKIVYSQIIEHISIHSI